MKKKKWKRLLAIILCTGLMLGCLPNGLLYAESETQQTTEATTQAPAVPTTVATTEASTQTTATEKTTEATTEKATATTENQKSTAATTEKAAVTKNKTAKTARAVATSTNLNEFVTKAEMAGSLRPGQEYSLKLSFQETPGVKQFADRDTLTYTLPEQLKGISATAYFDIPVEDSQGKVTITGNKYTISDKTITVQFNTKDGNFDRLTACANTVFQLDAKIALGENATGGMVDFGNEIKKEINIENNSDITIKKDGYYDQKDQKIHYTVRVKSTGNNKNVVVTDTVNGTLLTYDRNVKASSNKGGTVSGTISNEGDKGFTYTIPSMTHDEEITLTYTASVNLIGMTGTNVTKEQTNNTVKVTSTEDPTGDTAQKDFAWNIYYDWIQKSGTAASDTTEENGRTYRTVNWTITVNPTWLTSVAGKKITDTIPQEYRANMKYSGNGIRVNRVAKDGTGSPTEVSWNTLGVTDLGSAYAWDYTIPSEDKGIYKYEITYTTRVDVTDKVGMEEYKNQVSFENGKDTEIPGVGVIGEGGDVHCWKDTEKVTNDEVQWKIQFNVPKTGLNKCTIYDELPMTTINGIKYSDTFKGIDSVEGLLDGETYNVEEKNGIVSINFQNDGKDGLKASDNEREMIIYLTTTNNQEWVQAGVPEHVNNAWITANNLTTGKDDAKAYIENANIEKTGRADGTITVNGVNLPKYSYTLTLKGVEKEEQTITDTFNTEYFKYLDGSITINGGDTPEANENTGGTAEVVSTATGMKINIKTLPKKSNGSLYRYYKVNYSLMVKDADAFSALCKSATSNPDGKFVIKNTAEWNSYSDSYDLDYTYIPINKWLITYPTSQNGYKADYKITINEQGAKLSDSNTLTVEDTLDSNLRFVPGSLKMKVNGTDMGAPAYSTKQVSEGTLLSVTVPDGAKIELSYQAMVIGSGSIQFKNKAKLLGFQFDKTTDNWVSVNTSGSGGASNPYIKLKKVSLTNNNIGLKDAEFKLYHKTGDNWTAVQDKSGSDVVFKTGTDGVVIVEGSQEKDGWTLIDGQTYKLSEITAPEGYINDNAEAVFTIDKTASGEGVYTHGETIVVSNGKVNFQIQKVAKDTKNPLKGAGFTLYKDAECKDVVQAEQITKDNGIVSFEKLTAGTYYLKETKTPAGYVPNDTVYIVNIAADESVSGSNGLTFDKNGSGVFTAEIENELDKKEVQISKTDINGTKEIAGATLTVTHKDGDQTVQDAQWESVEDQTHKIELRPGKYTLTETGVPNGYQKAESIDFTVNEDGTVTVEGKTDGNKVVMKDDYSSAKFSKRDVAGEELVGAILKITDIAGNPVADINGNLIADWTSNGTVHEVKGLKDGSYLLTEITAPDGYLKADSVAFVIEGGKVKNVADNTVVMTDADSRAVFKKTDVAGNEIEGAKLKITDEAGQVVEEWTSSPTTEVGGHVVNNLKDGTYTLTETQAPSGYVLTAEIQFTIKEGKVYGTIDNTVTMQDDYSSANFKKTDIAGEELKGAVLKITNKDGSDVTDVTGKLVESWTSDGTAHEVKGLLDGEYVLTETSAPDGYAIAESVGFTIKDGKVQNKEDNTVVMKDGYSSAKFSKRDVAGNELKGAVLKITDEEGNPVKDIKGNTIEGWTSDGTIHEVAGLMDGKYLLTETTAPDGYLKSESVAFVIEGGKVKDFADQIVVMTDEDSKAVFKKTDVAGNEIEGAKLKITDEAGQVVEEWTSSPSTEADGHVVKNLKDGTYTLTETQAPSGYVVAEEIQFTIKEGKVEGTTDDTVIMKDDYSSANFKKTDIAGEELKGAVLKVTNKDGSDVTDVTGKLVESWTSDGTAHEVKGLLDGEYVLTETSAPDGYEIAESMNFTIKDGKVDKTDDNTVVMVDKYSDHTVVISKEDIAGKEIAGAELEITKKADGTSVEKWVSEEGKSHQVELQPGDYILTETTVPNGYVKAESIGFTVGIDGKITVEGNEAGKVTMVDDTTKVKISKQTITGDKELPGAFLQVLDKNGKVIDSWISGDTPHEINGKLIAGETYTLKEVKAPKGYKIAESIDFTVRTDGQQQTVQMIDEEKEEDLPSRNPSDDDNSVSEDESYYKGGDKNKNQKASDKNSSESSKSAKTGDETPMTVLLLLFALSVGTATTIVIRKRKNK